MTESVKTYTKITIKTENGGAKQEPRVPVARPFAEDSSSDEDNPKDKKLTASQMFDKKYASTKTQRIIEKSLAEDPSIYEYDEVYDSLKRTRGDTEEKKKADEERKPKYVANIIKAHKRRELHKLVHDEHTYKKEREKEAGQFDDSEAFITGSYRKQIEERERFRQEIELEDAMDEMTSVKDQKMWQQAFHRKLLDDITGDDPSTSADAPLAIKKEEIKVEEETTVVEDSRTQSPPAKRDKSSTTRKRSPQDSSTRRRSPSPARHRSPSPARREERPSARTRSPTGRKRSPEERRKASSPRRERKHSKSSADRKHSKISPERKHSKSSPERKHSKGSPEGKKRLPKVYSGAKSPTEDEMAARMTRIVAILAKRNGPEEIEAARQRFFERQASGSVVPPT